MIPHIIHYCWFGGNPLPKASQKYINSWRKFFPGWEIIRWDESNFDVHAIPYISAAYKAKKYAFVSDYARYKILYENGGIYFDTDVEVIKDMSDIVADGAFMGCEEGLPSISVNPGLGVGAPAGHMFYKKMLNVYSTLDFTTDENIVTLTTSALREVGLRDVSEIQECGDITIYPTDYFCPIDYNSRKLVITSNTRSIHHFAESWIPFRTKVINAAGRLVGTRVIKELVYLKRFISNTRCREK